jgi:hypothetical protein
MDPPDLIPERRAKSWKREHEERCRRHQNNNDQKKSHDPGCGSDQSVLLEIKDNSSDFVKDAVGVEKMEMSAGDKLDGSGIDDGENEGTFSLRSTTEDSVIERGNTNKACLERDLVSDMECAGRMLCDSKRNEMVFPFLQSTECSDLKTEKTLSCKQYSEKKGKEDFIEINGFNVNFKGDCTKSGHVSGDLSVCEIMMEEEGKSTIIFQQFEVEAAGNTPEGYYEISGWTETGSSELHKAQLGLLEGSSDLSGIPVLKGTDLVQLETLPGVDEVMYTSLEIPEGTQLRASRIPEEDTTLLTDVKPETLESAIPRCLDILQDAPLDRVSGEQSGFADVLQGFSGNLRALSEYSMNTEEPVQRTDALHDTGSNLGNRVEEVQASNSDLLKLGDSCLSEGILSDSRSFGIVDLLDSSQDIEHINSSSSDLESKNRAPNEHQKSSLKIDDEKGSVDAGDCIFSSSETPGNVTKEMNEEGTLGIEQERNLFVELSCDKNSVTPVECVDKTEHFIFVLGSARSPSPFQERDQDASEFLEDHDSSGELNKFLTDRSLGSMAVEYKDTEQEQGINLGNPTGELSEENSKHLMDEPVEEMAEDTSAGSKYCLGVDTVPEQIEPSEVSSLHPSGTSSEDKVDFFVLMLPLHQFFMHNMNTQWKVVFRSILVLFNHT